MGEQKELFSKIPMLDLKVADILNKLVETDLKEGEDRLKREIEIAHSKLAMQGLGRSGAVIQTIGELCVAEVKRRIDSAWRELKRIVRAVNARSSTLRQDLKDEMRRHVPQILDGLQEILSKKVELIGFGSAPDLSRTTEQALKKIEAEIEIFVLSIESGNDQTLGTTRSEKQLRERPASMKRAIPIAFLSHSSQDNDLALRLATDCGQKVLMRGMTSGRLDQGIA